MELDLNGLEFFEKNKKAYINTIKDLCYLNNIPAIYRNAEDEVSLCLIDEHHKGIFISTAYRTPFFLDKDDASFPTSDCPSIQDAFFRLWNLNRLLKVKQPFSREKVLNKTSATNDLCLMHFEPNDAKIDSYMEKVNNEAIISDALEKQAIIFTCEVFKNQIGENDPELADEMIQYVLDNMEEGQGAKNIQFMQDWFKELSEVQAI